MATNNEESYPRDERQNSDSSSERVPMDSRRTYHENSNEEQSSEGKEKRKRVRIIPKSQTPERENYRANYGDNQDRRSSYQNDRPSRESSYKSDYPRREGGYQSDRPRREGGYNNERPNYDGGGYQRTGGYNSERPNREGGYQRTGGYNNDRPNREGGYQSDRPRREGGYNSDRPNREGGYQRTGGYNNDRPNREGGYQNDRPRREGGYQSDRERTPYGNRDQRGGYDSRSNDFSRPAKKRLIKQVKYKESTDPNAPIRLNKYMANAGVCSRREADELIVSGQVSVNGVVVKELGTKITRKDIVTYHEKTLSLESKVYVLLNKPKGFITTSDDPKERKTVMDLVKNACSERIYPVGRLDRATTGVLLLTNDGDLASKLTHPKYEKRKIYQVWLDKDVSMEHMQTIADGIELEDGEIHADAISYVSEEDMSQIGIEIHSGRNRIVRRIFEKLGYQVLKLDRVYFAGLTKKNLPKGKWRYLSEKEVNMLRMGAFE